MDYLECDDMMEGTSEYCAFDHKYCDENRIEFIMAVHLLQMNWELIWND